MAIEGVVVRMPLFDEDGGVGAGAGATGAAADSTGSAVSGPIVGVTGTPAPDTKAWEAERAGFLRDLQAERKARQQYEQQFGTAQAELQRERKRVQALAGVNPLSPEDVEAAEIKKRFAQIYPELAELTAEDIKALRSWKEQAGQFQETTQAMWRDKARQMTSAVEARIAKELGGGDLTPRQIKNIRAAYVHAAEENPEFLARHEQGDMKLVEEFATQFIEDWFEPARRKLQQQQVNQFRRVPNGKDRSAPGTAGPKIDVKDPKAVEDLLVSGFKERGGMFGRR